MCASTIRRRKKYLMFVCSAIQNAQRCANGHSARQPIKFNNAQMKKVNKRIRNGRAGNGRELEREIQKGRVQASSNFKKELLVSRRKKPINVMLGL